MSQVSELTRSTVSLVGKTLSPPEVSKTYVMILIGPCSVVQVVTGRGGKAAGVGSQAFIRHTGLKTGRVSGGIRSTATGQRSSSTCSTSLKNTLMPEPKHK